MFQVEQLIIIDLEATCWPPGDIRRPQQAVISEPIELYAVRYDRHTSQLGESFHTLIQPVQNPTLSDFCTSLTGLTQDRIDMAPKPDEALDAFRRWIQSSVCIASWGTSDDRLLRRWWSTYETGQYPWVHYDIKRAFEVCCRAHQRENTPWFTQSGLKRITGLSQQEALLAVGGSFSGPAHSAQTDTLAAVECLSFACTLNGLTPREQFIMTTLQTASEHGSRFTSSTLLDLTPWANKQALSQLLNGLSLRQLIHRSENGLISINHQLRSSMTQRRE